MNDLISIIIVNWNGKKWLERCFDSLSKQTYKNFEVVFVDNNSTDSSVEFTKENYSWVRVVQNDTNAGFAGGNNLGIQNARGAYILLLNSDTWCENDFLEKIVASFHENGCDVLGVTETEYENHHYKHYIMSLDPFGYFVTIKNDIDNVEPFYISGACVFFPKTLYQETGGLDADFFMYCEEIDWFWRLHLFKKKVYQDQNIFIHHAGGGSIGSGIKYQTFFWRNQNILQMLLKNYAWYSLVLVLPIYFLQNIFEILAFLIFLKPKIAWSYVDGWRFNIKHFPSTLKKRKWIQNNRLVGDLEIMKKMYFGSGKLRHLFQYFKFK
jgi:hypothetical protein